MLNHDRDAASTPAHSRRACLGLGASARSARAAAGRPAPPAGPAVVPGGAPDSSPWYRRALRWGQTNITEIDPTSYDIAWWRRYWRDTRVQGVIVNAGGIVA